MASRNLLAACALGAAVVATCCGAYDIADRPANAFASGTKKGIAAVAYRTYGSVGGTHWNVTQAQTALSSLSTPTHWWYDYSFPPAGSGITPPNAGGGGKYMPMFWDDCGTQFTGDNAVTNANIDQAASVAGVGGWIMVFNEAYNGSSPGCNGSGWIDPFTAAAKWDQIATRPSVRSNAIHLLSPVFTNSTTVITGTGYSPETWFRTFWNAIGSGRYPDAIALHRYGAAGVSGATNVATVMTAVQRVEALYPGYPIMITETGIAATTPTDADNTNFLGAVSPIENDGNVMMWGWFYGGPHGIPLSSTYTNSSLFNDDTTLTAAGTAFSTLP